MAGVTRTSGLARRGSFESCATALLSQILATLLWQHWSCHSTHTLQVECVPLCRNPGRVAQYHRATPDSSCGELPWPGNFSQQGLVGSNSSKGRPAGSQRPKQDGEHPVKRGDSKARSESALADSSPRPIGTANRTNTDHLGPVGRITEYPKRHHGENK